MRTTTDSNHHRELAPGEEDNLVNVGDVDAILTVKQIHAGLMYSTPESDITLTFPSAEAFVKFGPRKPVLHTCRRFSIRNDGTAAITIVAGAGGSINGSSTVSASSYAAHYVLRFTSITPGLESYQIIRN